MKALSLFSGAGIGEYYFKEIGIDVVIANEIKTARARAHRFLYPDCEMITADIQEQVTQDLIVEKAQKQGIKLIIATPPCQGLSTAGSNKSEESLYTDPRNYLILSALNIVSRLKPDYFIIENVPRFQKMKFTDGEEVVSLLELLKKKYSDEYEINCEVFNAAEYSIPQTRLRVVYTMWKKGLSWAKPAKASKMITVEEAIGNLPSLEPGEDSGIKNHIARLHPANHIECMRYTPTGKSAFINKEHYPKKPDGSRITGYPNSYKRIRWDMPAPTVTMRNEIISSQENVHPGRDNGDGTWSDARVLTLRELLIISSLPPDMEKPDNLTDTAFRQLIGEGIPPKLMEAIMKGIGK